MNVAEKEITIAQNVPKVFNAGYEKGKAEGGVLDYATSLEFEDQIFDADVIEIEFGAKVAETTSPDSNILIPNFYSASGMKHLKVDFLGKYNKNETFTYDSKFRFNRRDIEDTLEIIELPIIEKLLPSSLNRAFQDRRKLKEIRATIDATHCKSFGNNGLGCPLLEEIRFKPNTIFVNPLLNNCPLLSNESIESTVNGLADLTGQESQTITFHADVKAKLTDEQITTITSKNWTLA